MQAMPTLSDANTYADNGDAATLQSAQSYADSVVTSGTGNLTTDDIQKVQTYTIQIAELHHTLAQLHLLMKHL